MRLTANLYRYIHKGHRPPRALRARTIDRVFNNKWHTQRELTVTDPGFKEACLERGIQVFKPNEVFSSYLPEKKMIDLDFEKLSLVKKQFENEEDHPYYHDRPAYSFLSNTRLPMNAELLHAKALLKTVEVSEGLPDRLVKQFGQLQMPHQDNLLQRMIQETQIFDATQTLLPKNYAVPYIGWHPVLDKMSAKVPYEVTMSWQWRKKRDYGIPIARKNMNLLREMFSIFDRTMLNPTLLERNHLENVQVRQFFEKEGNLVRIYLPLSYVITDRKPLQPYADPSSTTSIGLPDLSPLNPLNCLWPRHVYNEDQNFPLKASLKTVKEELVHTVVDLYNAHIPLRRDDGYHARSLVNGFLMALGQARHLFGPEVKYLPHPVTVHSILTDGRKFHLSVYQLNTLDLDGTSGVKNIFWHEPELHQLYTKCAVEKALPIFEGYDPNVADKLRTMYLA